MPEVTDQPRKLDETLDANPYESPRPKRKRTYIAVGVVATLVILGAWYFLIYLRPASFRKLHRVLDHQGATISIVHSYAARPPLTPTTLSPQESERLRMELKRRMPFTIKPHVPWLGRRYVLDCLWAVISVHSGQESCDVAILDHEFSADMKHTEAHERVEFQGLPQLLAEMEAKSQSKPEPKP